MPRRLTRFRSLAAAFAAAMLSVVACSSDGPTETVSEAASATAGECAADTGAVLDAATFEGDATTVSGDSFDLAGLADKDLVLWFWAPW